MRTSALLVIHAEVTGFVLTPSAPSRAHVPEVERELRASQVITYTSRVNIVKQM
jgi:hypothetical protein